MGDIDLFSLYSQQDKLKTLSIQDKVKYRVELLQACLRDQKLQAYERELCSRDPIHWLNNWVWIFEPRLEVWGINHIPLVLKEFQEEAFLDIINGNSFVLEKTREMGATWIILAAYTYLFLYRPAQQLLIFSEQEDKVDDWTASSLIGKAKYILDWLPDFLGFKEDVTWKRTFLKITNLVRPENCLKGDSSSDNVGRGGRNSRIFWDEAAFCQRTFKKWASIGNCSKSIQLASTVNGKNNIFAYLRFSGKMKVYTWHWSNDPDKGPAWYKAECERLIDPVLIAQELDINYEASVRGQIYAEYIKPENIIELNLKNLRVLGYGRTYDVGYSKDPTVCLTFAMFKNHLDEICLYFFREHDDADKKQQPDWHALEILKATPEAIDIETGDIAGEHKESDLRSYYDKLNAESLKILRSTDPRFSMLKGRTPIKIYYTSAMGLGLSIMIVRSAIIKNRVFVSPSCLSLVESLKTYRQHESKEGAEVLQRETKTEIFNPIHDDSSHYCDAFRYAVYNVLSDLVREYNPKELENYAQKTETCLQMAGADPADIRCILSQT